MTIRPPSILVALVLAVALGAAAQESPAPAPAASAAVDTLRAGDTAAVVRSFEGIASWYGRHFHGRRTASGERFDRQALTCASRTLPFGTRVRVTNLGTGESVVVRVNDRGPYVRRRVIDLSSAAARAIDMVGCARVRVDVLDLGAAAPALFARTPRVAHRHPRPAVAESDSQPVAIADTTRTPDSVDVPPPAIAASMRDVRFTAAPRDTQHGAPLLRAHVTRIVDADGRTVEAHGYAVVVCVTNRFASARAVADELVVRGYANVHLAMTSMGGEHLYRVCLGFEPHPIACRLTRDHLRSEYPTTTITYIGTDDYDRDHPTAFAN